MGTLISLVGNQPGAVASTVSTLAKKNLLSHVLLLPGPKTNEHAIRLEKFIHTFFTEVHVSIQPISSNTSGDQKAWNSILNAIQSNKYAAPYYYDTSPGLNYQVALISYHLKNCADIVPIYADHTQIHFIESDMQSIPLENIGLKDLLMLHNLSMEIKNSVTMGKEIQNMYINDVHFLELRECYGKLHGIIDLLFDSNTTNKKAENDRIKIEARSVLSIVKQSSQLNSIRPFVNILTNHGGTKERMESKGVPVTYHKDYLRKTILKK